MTRLLAISGSLRAVSTNTALLGAARLLAPAGVEIAFYDGLARLRHSEPGKVLEWLTHHTLYTSAEFPVRAFSLYSSKLTSDGSIYRIEQEYPLEIINGEVDD